ncbi:MAG: hypothetical protein LBO09_06465 [Candidatus Peribacteria bacterium]|nr:hypothetical protein [Candidatus Peribacteria bacterium]
MEKCTQFTDLNQTNPELQSYIIQACKFGLMGYYSDGVTVKPNFDPNAKLPLTELATTISRLLRGEKYKGSGEWRYQSHLLALQKAGIIPFNLDPMKNELREEVYGILQKITE